jgi:hypothetical protein
MPAPIKYPDWATDGTNTVEPPAGKVAAGWLPAEQPPAGWFNWWQRNVGEWTRWLESLIAALTGRVDTLEADMDAAEVVTADAARKSQQNTFTKTQIINSDAAHADDPLISTIGHPGDDPTDLSAIDTPEDPHPPGSNHWKIVIGCPTKDSASAGIFVGQPPYGAALANNARWHVGTQKWRQIDGTFPSTALVGQRPGQ